MHVVKALLAKVPIVSVHEAVNAQVQISLCDYCRITEHQQAHNEVRYQAEQHYPPCLGRQVQSISFWLRVDFKYYI